MKFSGGRQQICAISNCALLNRPKLIIDLPSKSTRFIFIKTGGCTNNMNAQASHQRSTEVLTQQHLFDKLGTKLQPVHQAVGLARQRWMKMDVDDEVDKLYIQL